MVTFVLVHGGWHGGWCWQRVSPHLRAQGHIVYTPTLTGLGERAYLAHPDVGLETHVQDIIDVLIAGNLEGVVLVGHSAGGTVITGVADRVPQRLAHLVYLEGTAPRHGQSHADCVWPNRAMVDELVATQGEGWLLPVQPPESMGIVAAADVAWVAPQLTPHPYKTLTDPVRRTNPAAELIPHTYIACTGHRLFKKKPAYAAPMSYRTLAAGHDAMITDPRGLAAMLLDLVADRG